MRALALALALCSCAAAQRAGIVVGAAASSAMVFCDYRQTMWASDSGAWDRPGPQPNSTLVEMDPLLGQRPSTAALTNVAGLSLAAGQFVAFAPGLPRWVKLAYFGVVTVVEATLVVGHRQIEGACGR